MALLIESYCVIIKISSIEKIFPEGLSGFHFIIPSGVLYRDENLLSIRFMNPNDATKFGSKLSKLGFGDIDMACVSQTKGMMHPSDWLNVSMFEMEDEGHVVMIAYTENEVPVEKFAAPSDWQYEKSLSDVCYNSEK